MATKPYFGPDPPAPEMAKPPQDTDELLESMGMGGMDAKQREKVLAEGSGYTYDLDEEILKDKKAVQAAGLSTEDFRNWGNELYGAGKFKEAVEKYTDALESAKKAPSPLEPDINAISKVLSNRAACWLKLKQWRNVIEDCERCLQFDNTNWKAHWRKGEAHRLLEGTENAEAAISSYRSCLALQGLPESASKRVEAALRKLEALQ
uniref:Uncharacterized protein n=1 Tax=Lotharella globosa TaxID=91324 RepID=A0A7S3ZBD5_9EUKA|mmetsp:Transcript_13286/g.25232  ORF Transcript_13286/g.25232 Transcript_13286/m.25232 type:complete len:206 (-) Transcript_13286:201-818(-)